MFIRMLKLPDEVRADATTCRRCRCVVHAAAPCPAEVKAQMIEWFGPDHPRVLRGHRGQRLRLLQQRGLARPPGHGRARRSSATLHIVDDDGEEVPDRRVRHRLLRGRQRLRATTTTPRRRPARATRRAGAGRTLGDVGYLDEDGFLYLTDRKAYMIITGGVNVYPQEAENVLAHAPEGGRRRGLRRAQRRLRRGGQGRGASPSTMADAGPELERELIALLPGAPGRREVPPLGRLPRPSSPATPPGKLYKRLLKDEYWAAAGRSI